PTRDLHSFPTRRSSDLLRPRWNNIRRWSHHRDNRSLRPRSSPDSFSILPRGVRCRPIGGAGNLQEMRTSLRLWPFLLPVLRAETDRKSTRLNSSHLVIS